MSDEELDRLGRLDADKPFALEAGGGDYTLTEQEVVWVNAARAALPALVARLKGLEAEVGKLSADNTRLRAENKRLADDVQEWYAAHRSRLTR